MINDGSIDDHISSDNFNSFKHKNTKYEICFFDFFGINFLLNSRYMSF